MLANSDQKAKDKIGSEPGVVAKLVVLLRDPSAKARCYAVDTLGRLAASHSQNQAIIGCQEGAISTILDLTLDRDPGTSTVAVEALQHIVSGHKGNMAAAERAAARAGLPPIACLLRPSDSDSDDSGEWPLYAQQRCSLSTPC